MGASLATDGVAETIAARIGLAGLRLARDQGVGTQRTSPDPRSAGRLGGSARSALSPPLAAGTPGRLLGGPRFRGRRGHRPGVVSRGGSGAGSLRSSSPLRPLAASDRRQPGDRLGTSAGPFAERPRSIRTPTAHGIGARATCPRPSLLRGDPRRPRIPVARAPRGRRPSLPPRLHPRRDRPDARASARNCQLPPSPGPRSAGGPTWGRSANERAAPQELFVDAPVPDEQGAEERGWRVVRAAFESRIRDPARPRFEVARGRGRGRPCRLWRSASARPGPRSPTCSRT